MKRIIAIALLAALALPVIAEKVSAEDHKKNTESIAEFKRVGWLESVDASAQTAVVAPSAWKKLTYKQKVGLMIILSEYFEYETDLKSVTVRDKYTNKKVGSYGVFRGFKVYD